MAEMARIREEQVRLEVAELARAFVELLGKCNEMTGLEKLVGFTSRELGQLERIHARGSVGNQECFVDAYLDIVERRYAAGKARRFLTLGLTANRQADIAAEGALREVQRLIDVLEEVNSRRIAGAVAARLDLIRLVLGTQLPQREREAAVAELVQSVVPPQVARLLPLVRRVEEERERRRR